MCETYPLVLSLICSHNSLKPQSVTALCWCPLLKHSFSATCFVYMVIYWFEDWFEHLSSVHNTFKIQLSPFHLPGLRGGGWCQVKRKGGTHKYVGASILLFQV